MRIYLIGVLLLILLMIVAPKLKAEKLFVRGQCYHLVEGQEKENHYYVPCGKDNTDIGFNEPNCALILGTWRVWDKSCITNNGGKKWRWWLENDNRLNWEEYKSVAG